MTQPWLLFLCVTLGLIAGGGTEILSAPTQWLVEGRNAPRIMQAQVCALEAL